MTPQLQLAIKLLQMSRMELVETVRQELLENPVLEDLQAEPSADRPPPGEVAHAAEPVPDIPEQGRDHASAEADKKASEIDWERYLENHAMQAPMPGGSHRGFEELPSYETSLSRGEDLVDHLEWQVRMSDMVEDETRFAALVLGNLDEKGYLSIEGLTPEEVVPKLAGEADLNPED